MSLQRCHVIEGMVQLLANGLVLQLLSIQFIWTPEVDKKQRQVPTTAATQASRKQESRARDRWRQRAEGERKRQKNRSAFLKMQKCLEERMMNT